MSELVPRLYLLGKAAFHRSYKADDISVFTALSTNLRGKQLFNSATIMFVYKVLSKATRSMQTGQSHMQRRADKDSD